MSTWPDNNPTTTDLTNLYAPPTINTTNAPDLT